MARSFNGSSYITLPTGIFSSNVLSISIWWNVVWSSPVGYESVFSIYNGNTDGFEIFHSNAANSIFAGAFNSQATGTVVDGGGWQNVIATSDGTAVKVYTNGTIGSNGTTAFSTFSINSYWATRAASFNIANGNALADGAIWNVVLGSTDITAIVNGVRPANVQSAHLIGWWPLDGYASPEPDLSTGGHNGTLTGTTGIIGPPQLWRIAQG